MLAVIAFSAHAFMQNGIASKEGMMIKEEETMMPKEDTMMKAAEADMGMKEDKASDDGMMDTSEKMQKGSYEAYAPDKLALAATGDVVLFFHASWCPSCRGLNADIEANLSALPVDVTLLKVDYDTETELKKKYGVTTQHTLVQVAADGSLIKKWSGSPTLARLIEEIN